VGLSVTPLSTPADKSDEHKTFLLAVAIKAHHHGVLNVHEATGPTVVGLIQFFLVL